MKPQASVAAGDSSIIRDVLGRRSTFMVPSASVGGGQNATPERKNYVEYKGRIVAPRCSTTIRTPHIK